ncbi:alpha/beta fold hydrolase [Cystobacter ferrugineus]|uniref:alpha/beta fold hydrolase n=1 Tax=Cystobacter ferrugineus TaxID=83449 RepID=UPI003CCB8B79
MEGTGRNSHRGRQGADSLCRRRMERIRTELLDIAYEAGGPVDGPVLLLLHGWPDDVRGWRHVAPRLHAAGYRMLAPYLRGSGPTRVLSSETFRDGRAVALARDAIDFANALGLQRFAVVGHDWGHAASSSCPPSRNRACSGTSGSCAWTRAPRPFARTRRASPASSGTRGARQVG